MSGAMRFSSALVLLFIFFVGSVLGVVYFSQLPRTLVVTASPKPGQVLLAGEEKITISWQLNKTLAAGTDAGYKKVKVKLCYAPVSQQNRGWRKTNDELKKDKTCQFTAATQPYAASGTVDYTLERDLPTATYFVRAYVLNADGTEVAYGQSTDAHKTSNLFQVEGISGRHTSLDIAAGCFSAFSVVALLFFFVKEKRKGKK